jgi:hypothetical protein
MWWQSRQKQWGWYVPSQEFGENVNLFFTSRRVSGGHFVVQPANQLRHQFKPHDQWCRVNHSLRQPLRGIVVVVVAVSAVAVSAVVGGAGGGSAGGGSAGGGSVVELVVVMVEIIVVVVLAVDVAVVIIEVDIVDSVAVDILVAATAVVVVIVVVVVVIAGTRFLHALTTMPTAAAIRALQCPTVLEQCQHTHGHFHLTVAGREIVLV